MSEPLAPPPATDAPAAPAPGAPPPASGLARLVLFRLEAALLVILALLSLAFYLKLPADLPSEADYLAAASDITARGAAGDAVLLDPHWAERARLFVTGTPVLNLARRPTREDLRGYGRLFVLSLPNLPRSDREATFRFLESAGFRRLEAPRAHGNLSVTLFENSNVERPSFDFTGEVASAKVYIRRPDGSEELCPRSGNRHPCPRAGWINVGEELREIDSKPQRCLWAHPAGNEPLVIEYADAPLDRRLEVMGGIVGQIVHRRENYSTTTLQVKIDDKLFGQLELRPGEPGELRRSLDTSAFAGTRHKVQFEVTAPNPDMRHFCFDAGAYP